MIELPEPLVDFTNTEVAFSSKTNDELRKASWLFSLMNSALLVSLGSRLGLAALKMGLPVESIVKKTIFEQFCGGTTLLETKSTIDKLGQYGSLSILDYGAEGKNDKIAFDQTLRESINAIHFAAQNTKAPVISLKVTGLARFELLEKLQKNDSLTPAEKLEYNNALKRLDSICHVAHENGVGVFIDAEESWIQDTIDYLANMMMARYNKDQVIIYNTFQLYRHDRLRYLKHSYKTAVAGKYLLGAKLVRGAYMDKERARAEKFGYPSPIQPDKRACDKAFNLAVKFCVKHYTQIGSCAATHNLESCKYQAQLIEQFNLPRNHPHLNFCQLYGMSDHLTFNLSKAGFNVAKYLPYGPVKDVIPYLIRRAQENSAVTGDMSRELQFIRTEMKRRGM